MLKALLSLKEWLSLRLEVRRFEMSPRRPSVLVVALLLFGLSESAGAPTTIARGGKQGPWIAKTHGTWRRAILEFRAPGTGCFKAAFPLVEWRQVSCVTRPTVPYDPRHGPTPFTVGGNNDYAARVMTGSISGAEGSFDSVTGVTSETGQVGGTGAQVANVYTLQLNTKPFTATTACMGSPNMNCLGWQQFVYSSGSGSIFIQYWLLKYNAACPAGWITRVLPSAPNDTYCYRNGASTASFPRQPITNLRNLSLGASANANANDIVTISNGTTAATALNPGNTLSLSTAWKDAEFAIVGDGRSSQASFNAGSTIVVRTSVHNGTMNAPICVVEGFTGETNNLDLVDNAIVGAGQSPSIVSRQSNTLTSMRSCQAATGVGEPHLTTFKGLLYDFQATGEFVLAEAPPNFVVQTRQVTAPPPWPPNVAANKAIATRMGKTRVAVCLPRRVEVNGKATTINPASPLILPTGVDISRIGNAYLIRGPQGETVHATVYPDWIDVSVGLGQKPLAVRGLLANANNNVHQVATSTGTVLTWPIAFKTLYHRYGDSWRVKPGRSLLCKAKKVPNRNPTRPFYAKDLKRNVAQRARTICRKARVRRGPLLEACTLDVAVTGRAVAAKAYVGARAPVAVGKPK
jgi:hypothetical protein